MMGDSLSSGRGGERQVVALVLSGLSVIMGGAFPLAVVVMSSKGYSGPPSFDFSRT